ALMLLIALLGGVLWAGYAWSQRQFYVGTDGTSVVLYQGLSQDLGPISMSEPVVVTDIALEDLPEVTQQQVENTITASDRESAEEVIDRLEQVALANRPPPVVTPQPSDGGGASDAGGAADSAVEADQDAAEGSAADDAGSSPGDGEAT